MKKDSSKKVKGYPEDVLKRLPVYLSLLKLLKIKGRTDVSVHHLAEDLNYDIEQVKEDVFMTGMGLRHREVFPIGQLIDKIEQLLGFRKMDEAFLVGAGKLGSLLMRYQDFRQLGIKIVAAFDTDKDVVGSEVEGVKILHMDKFFNLASRMHMAMGIVATPASQAQEVADKMVQSGVKVIWNFAPAAIQVPDSIILENTTLSDELRSVYDKMKKHYLITDTTKE